MFKIEAIHEDDIQLKIQYEELVLNYILGITKIFLTIYLNKNKRLKLNLASI